jgi:hypothetical protein
VSARLIRPAAKAGAYNDERRMNAEG